MQMKTGVIAAGAAAAVIVAIGALLPLSHARAPVNMGALEQHMHDADLDRQELTVQNSRVLSQDERGYTDPAGTGTAIARPLEEETPEPVATGTAIPGPLEQDTGKKGEEGRARAARVSKPENHSSTEFWK